MLDEIWVFRRCFDFISILNGKMPSCQHTFFSVTKSGESTFFQPGRTEPLKKNGSAFKTLYPRRVACLKNEQQEHVHVLFDQL
jgi:hypothetical protein